MNLASALETFFSPSVERTLALIFFLMVFVVVLVVVVALLLTILHWLIHASFALHAESEASFCQWFC